MKLIIFIIASVFSLCSYADNSRYIDKYSNSIFKISTINKTTNASVSYGTGFLVDSDGYIITNYHVVSGYLSSKKDEEKILEYKRASDSKNGNVEVINFDIINDLALLKIDDTDTENYFTIGETELYQGDKLFSFGNPLSVGTIVVNGTYNGFLDNSIRKKINFTGPINSGMSGGPVINESEVLIGVNVETSGNGVGYLVNAEHVKTLYNKRKIESKNFEEIIEESLESWSNEITQSALKNIYKSKVKSLDILKLDKEGFTCSSSNNIELKNLNMTNTYHQCGTHNGVSVAGNSLGGIKLVHSRLISEKKEITLALEERMIRAHFTDISFNKKSCDVDYIKSNNKTFVVNTCITKHKDLKERYTYIVNILDKSIKDVIFVNSLSTDGLTKKQNILLTNKVLEELL